MALFKRNKNDSVLPEVDEYYQAERRDRGWLAWVLALVSVLVVVFTVIGLFMGGRWIWNKVTGNDDANEVGVSDNEASDKDEISVDGDPNETKKDDSSSDNEAAGDDNNSTGSAGTGGSGSVSQGTVNAPAATDTPSTGDSSGNSAATTPRTGDDTENLPSTGPASLLSTFMGVSTLAGGIHYIVERRKR
ncbi:MAG: hypothetical protein WAQ57_00605 [Candidatus Saccharimonadales bacterium]